MALPDALRSVLAAYPQVQLAVLFGSTARDAAGGRDVDVGVLLDPGSANDPELRVRLEANLGRTAGRPLDLVFLHQAPPLLRFEVARDGVVLVERQPYLWNDFKVRAMLDWWEWAPTARRLQAAAIRRLRERVVDGSA